MQGLACGVFAVYIKYSPWLQSNNKTPGPHHMITGPSMSGFRNCSRPPCTSCTFRRKLELNFHTRKYADYLALITVAISQSFPSSNYAAPQLHGSNTRQHWVTPFGMSLSKGTYYPLSDNNCMYGEFMAIRSRIAESQWKPRLQGMPPKSEVI